MGGNPTAGEVVLVETALLAGKEGVAQKFGKAFDEVMRLKYRPSPFNMGVFDCTSEDVKEAFGTAKKAIGL